MKSFLLLLVLLGLAAHAAAQSQNCADGATKNTGCQRCASGAADADCEYCKQGYWKSGAKACTVCPAGTGRDAPSTAITGVETEAACNIKSAPQLKCAIALSRYTCLTCASAQYKESAYLHGEVSATGCSTDCKSFDKSVSGATQFVPNAVTAPDTTPDTCTSCTSRCLKCEYAPTLKNCEGATASCAAGFNKQQTKCTECANGFYLKPNAAEPTAVVPTCEACGANCKKCKDATECTTCYPGWATDSTDKANCLKSVAISGNIIKVALISMIALFIAW